MTPDRDRRARSTSGSGCSPAGAAAAVERHQTLRATVDWSYQLLEPTERTVFDRLGVFAGTFDAAAAGAVVGETRRRLATSSTAIASLVAKSMLVAERAGPDGTTRYAMLETLRQYARERLDETGDADAGGAVTPSTTRRSPRPPGRL